MQFNALGRKIPTFECRVFDNAERNFYITKKLLINREEQHIKAQEHNFIGKGTDYETIEREHQTLYDLIKSNSDYQNILLGTSIPFAVSMHDLERDIGSQLEKKFLPIVKKNYEESQKGSWFKATLQGDNFLEDSLKVVERTGYDEFIGAVKSRCVVGYYFPTAFQEYDIESQRNQLNKLPRVVDFNVCVSGHIEASYALLMHPDLLFVRDSYSPILCLSAIEHNDPRMVPIFKSYGPHLEFWLLSQMMTPTQTQVSEQWAGGLTIYKSI